MLSGYAPENGHTQRRRILGREGRLPRTLQLAALVPSGVLRLQTLVPASEAHALQRLRRGTGPPSWLPDQRAPGA
eukprot:3463201-Alexandrium_andersonii.AAC.1